MEHFLKNEYISVLQGAILSYGGNQRNSESAVMQKCGCGVIAALDLLTYICRYHKNCSIPPISGLVLSNPADQDEYDKCSKWLSSHYLQLMPPLGINGLSLSLGLNLVFSKYKLPYHASWGVPKRNIFSSISEMLENNIPVILSVGQNFPKLWGKKKAAFYRLGANGEYQQAALTKAHYVTVTGIDNEWMQISSWGKKYYIRREDYIEYISSSSNIVLSNILFIRKKHSKNIT